MPDNCVFDASVAWHPISREVAWSDMAAEIRAIDFDGFSLAADPQPAYGGGHQLTELVRQDERRLVSGLVYFRASFARRQILKSSYLESSMLLFQSHPRWSVRPCGRGARVTGATMCGVLSLPKVPRPHAETIPWTMRDEPLACGMRRCFPHVCAIARGRNFRAHNRRRTFS